VPNPANPQAWNRFSYVLNNPIIFSDPSGHDPAGCDTDYLGTCSQYAASLAYQSRHSSNLEDELEGRQCGEGGMIDCPPPSPSYDIIPIPTGNGSRPPIDLMPVGDMCHQPFFQQPVFCNPSFWEPSLTYSINSHPRSSNGNILGPSFEIAGYSVDIFEYRELLSNQVAFKLGFGLDAIGQWAADSGKGYNLEARIERSFARGVQGYFVSLASSPFGGIGAVASEMAGPLPGDGLIGYIIGYVGANKTFSNATEPFMQNKVFPLFPIFTK